MRIAVEPVPRESLFLVSYRGLDSAAEVPADFRIALEAIAGSVRRVTASLWLVRCDAMRGSTLYDTLRMYGDVRDAIVVARVAGADVEGPLAPEVRRWLHPPAGSSTAAPPPEPIRKGA